VILDAVVMVDVAAIELSNDLILHQIVTADLANLQFFFTIIAHPVANDHLFGTVRVVNVAAIKLCDNLIRKQLVIADSASHSSLLVFVKLFLRRRRLLLLRPFPGTLNIFFILAAHFFVRFFLVRVTLASRGYFFAAVGILRLFFLGLIQSCRTLFQAFKNSWTFSRAWVVLQGCGSLIKIVTQIFALKLLCLKPVEFSLQNFISI
jgi:hypothetical protein